MSLLTLTIPYYIELNTITPSKIPKRFSLYHLLYIGRMMSHFNSTLGYNIREFEIVGGNLEIYVDTTNTEEIEQIRTTLLDPHNTIYFPKERFYVRFGTMPM